MEKKANGDIGLCNIYRVFSLDHLVKGDQL